MCRRDVYDEREIGHNSTDLRTFSVMPRTQISGIVKETLTVGWIPENEGRPLLAAVLYIYVTHGTSFPTLLWEVCKSAPGMLGERYWQAVLASRQRVELPNVDSFGTGLHGAHPACYGR